MMAKAWNQTRVSEVLGIEYPIIQGPLGGLSSQRLTAAVSNFGGLGSFGAHGLEPNAIEDVIAEIRSLTAKPVAINLWVSMEDARAHTSDAAAFRRALSHLSPHIEALGGTQPASAPYKPIRFEDQVPGDLWRIGRIRRTLPPRLKAPEARLSNLGKRPCGTGSRFQILPRTNILAYAQPDLSKPALLLLCFTGRGNAKA
jgi:hypothetical protein